MNCAQRNCVYALIGLSGFLQALPAMGEGSANISEATSVSKFQWHEHARLSWDDFKGDVNAVHDESAAATCCSIGFKTDVPVPGGKPEIIVYNTFYANKSWVRSDAKIQSILDHEQGHFDLCEVYTRKLKRIMSNIDPSVPGMKPELMRLYAQVSQEYEARQQAYELETIHGTNIAEQRKWQEQIANELM